MLLNKGLVDSNAFIQEFNKRFVSFSQKAPILLSFLVLPDGVELYEGDSSEATKKPLFFKKFDFSKPVKENIKEIKDILLDKYYPVFSVTKNVYDEYSAEELNDLISSGKSTIDMLDVKKQKKVVEKWRIERIITLRDEVFIRNLSENRCYRYRMKMPVTIFLRQCRESKNKDAMFDVLLSKGVFINEIYDDYNEREERK